MHRTLGREKTRLYWENTVNFYIHPGSCHFVLTQGNLGKVLHSISICVKIGIFWFGNYYIYIQLMFLASADCCGIVCSIKLL